MAAEPVRDNPAASPHAGVSVLSENCPDLSTDNTSPIYRVSEKLSETTVWQAYDARLGHLGPFHVRQPLADGGKHVIWRQMGEHQMADLIYLNRLPLPAKVVITEGEKAADAVIAAGVDAIGTVCGAGSIPGDAVMGLLTGAHVTLWPDADRTGFRHMARIAAKLERIVGSLRIVDLPTDVPQGWDAADATPELARRLVVTAHEVWLDR